MKPVRVEIPWKRMLKLLRLSYPDLKDLEYISTEKDLNDFFGNGRCGYSCPKVFLTDDEMIKLENIGFIHGEEYENLCLIVQKETYPGKYLIGEF